MIGGATSVVTRDPGKESEIQDRPTTGSFNGLDTDAVIDVPLTDTLQPMATLSIKNRDGYPPAFPIARQICAET